MRLFDALDGARYAKVSPCRTAIWVWCGGHTVNLYDSDGRCFDCFSVGDFSRNEATLEEVREAVEEMSYGGSEED